MRKIDRSVDRNCKKCLQPKKPDEFYLVNPSTCKSCVISRSRQSAIRLGKDHHAKKCREWAHNNRDKQNAIQVRRRARKHNASINDLTCEQWNNIIACYEHRCAYCFGYFEKLEMDHVVPLSNGGDHTESNVVPACRTRNAIKHDRHVSVMGFTHGRAA